jgi:hypothetical protein
LNAITVNSTFSLKNPANSHSQLLPPKPFPPFFPTFSFTLSHKPNTTESPTFLILIPRR